MISARDLFLCITASALALGTAPTDTLAQAGPVFEDGQAQIVPDFADPATWIRHQLWVETEFDSDGDGTLDRVHVDVTRPSQTESEGLRVPVIYETSPYYSGVGALDFQFFWNVKQEVGADPPPRTPIPDIRYRPEQPIISNSEVETWVPRGFAVIHSQSPGTGQSQGCPTVGGDNESLAPKAVIDWLNGRARGFTSADGDTQVLAEWATGKVGMTGTSYNGTLPIAAATTGVDGLEAIIPVSPNTSYYTYYRSNGLVRSPGGYLGEDVDVLYDFINSGNPERREWCNSNVRAKTLNANQDRKTGDYNDFWAGRDYLNRIEGIKAATLMAHGFNDWNVMPEHAVRITEALSERGVPVQNYFHQGGHGGPPPLPMMNRWFTHYLYGVDNGVEQDPRAWIVREGHDRENPTPYPAYPNPDATGVTLRVTAGGHELGGLSLDAPDAPVQELLTDDVSVDGTTLASQMESDHRLLYATPELTQELHLSGAATVKIRLAANTEAANLSVWLVSLPITEGGAITDNIITRGWADPQNRNSLRESTPLIPGEFVELAFDLQPDDQVIPAGQKIGLMIFSSDREFTLWPEPGTRLTVDLNGTSIQLPVVGGTEAYERAVRRPVS
jgi:X-Pro dipeptidyl-peptidase